MDSKTKIVIGIGAAALIGYGLWVYNKKSKLESELEKSAGNLIKDVEGLGEDAISTASDAVKEAGETLSKEIKDETIYQTRPHFVPTIVRGEAQPSQGTSNFSGVSDYVEVGSNLTDLG
jgi:hypothetical protein